MKAFPADGDVLLDYMAMSMVEEIDRMLSEQMSEGERIGFGPEWLRQARSKNIGIWGVRILGSDRDSRPEYKVARGQKSADGETMTLRLSGNGDSFGEVVALNGEVRMAIQPDGEGAITSLEWKAEEAAGE